MAVNQMNAKPAQQYEHLLFGSVSQTGLDSLLNRLRGLCDSPECKFNDRILTAIISEKYSEFNREKNYLSALVLVEPQGGATNSSLKATVRQSLDDPNAPM